MNRFAQVLILCLCWCLCANAAEFGTLKELSGYWEEAVAKNAPMQRLEFVEKSLNRLYPTLHQHWMSAGMLRQRGMQIMATGNMLSVNQHNISVGLVNVANMVPRNPYEANFKQMEIVRHQQLLAQVNLQVEAVYQDHLANVEAFNQTIQRFNELSQQALFLQSKRPSIAEFASPSQDDKKRLTESLEMTTKVADQLKTLRAAMQDTRENYEKAKGEAQKVMKDLRQPSSKKD